MCVYVPLISSPDVGEESKREGRVGSLAVKAVYKHKVPNKAIHFTARIRNF
jgi:hypothetical protein